ncbi:MAG: ABC transporter substrate-binding protein [Halanaeroarchaeum sp.]
MHDRRYGRRTFIASGTAAAAFALAGCLGDTPTGGGGSNSISYDSIEAWRADVSEAAAEELADEDLTFWARNPSAKKVLSKVLNGQPPEGSDVFPAGEPIIADDSPWAPLKGSVTVNEMTPSKQATKYRRQAKTGSVKVDVLTGDVGKQLQQGAPFMDFSKMPAWKRYTPEELKSITSKEAFFSVSTLGIVYNEETVDTPPETPLDLLGDAYSERIIVDASPPLVVPWLFLDEYQDAVPPRFQAMGEDMTGGEFIDGVAAQDPTITRSSYKATLEVGKGAVDASLFTPVPIMYSLQEEGLPVKPVEHPSAFVTSPDGLGVPKEPPHPNAAKLLVDYVLSHPKVKTCRPGWVTPGRTRSNPPELLKMLEAEWRDPQPAVLIENMAELGDEWRTSFDIPVA